MTMGRLRVSALVAVLALMFVAGSTVVGASASAPVGQSGGDANARSLGDPYDIGLPGTSWLPELRAKFRQWKPVAWGTQVKVKPAGVGDQWVHMPVAIMHREAGTELEPDWVTICAQSSAGARTMPIQLDLWAVNYTSSGTLISSTPVSWPADNAYHCVSVEPPDNNGAMALDISLLIHFANTTDQVTLGFVDVTCYRDY